MIETQEQFEALALAVGLIPELPCFLTGQDIVDTYGDGYFEVLTASCIDRDRDTFYGVLHAFWWNEDDGFDHEVGYAVSTPDHGYEMESRSLVVPEEYKRLLLAAASDLDETISSMLWKLGHVTKPLVGVA